MIKKIVSLGFISFCLSSSLGHAQTVQEPFGPSFKNMATATDLKAACMELRKVIQTWKDSTRKAQDEYAYLVHGESAPPISMAKKSVLYLSATVKQDVTNKLISDHYYFCYEKQLDSEINPMTGRLN